MSELPRYATLRDYLQVLRRSRLIVIVAVILFGAGAWALTAGDKSIYQATSSLSFQDPGLQTANLSQTSITPTNDAAARVQINAATITRPAIVAAVGQILPRVPKPSLTQGVSAAAQTATGFLVIQVQSTDAALAQALANAYALAVKNEERQTARSEFGIAATKLQQLANQPSIKHNPIAETEYVTRISNLQFASQTADPVTIATNASIPTSPISPHPTRDVLLGVLLGLTIGVLVAFGRDALDRRLRGSQEITAELQWPILGHIKERSLGRVGFIAANGHKQADDADLEAFRILRQNIQFLDIDHPPRSITVTSAKPEEGKSTVAAALACATALTGRLTLLIDADLRRPTLAKKLGVEGKPGLTDYILGEAEPEEVLRTIALGADAPATNGKRRKAPAETKLVPPQVAGSHLVVIPAGTVTSYPAELLSSQRLKSFLEQVSEAYDVVIIDTSPVLPVADALTLVSLTDAALICVRASQTTNRELRAVKHALGQLPPRPSGVVITGVRRGGEADFGYYSQRYQYR